MPLVHYEEADGTRHTVDVVTGENAMRGALNSGVPGIMGDCGGILQCATCHVYVDPEWLGLLPPPSDDEIAMIDGALDVQSNSRLSCQIALTDALDGILIRIPNAQF